MAVALELGVCYLLAEFAADAFIILGALKAAGAISALLLQALLDIRNYFGIFIQSYHFFKGSSYKRQLK